MRFLQFKYPLKFTFLDFNEVIVRLTLKTMVFLFCRALYLHQYCSSCFVFKFYFTPSNSKLISQPVIVTFFFVLENNYAFVFYFSDQYYYGIWAIVPKIKMFRDKEKAFKINNQIIFWSWVKISLVSSWTILSDFLNISLLFHYWYFLELNVHLRESKKSHTKIISMNLWIG